MSKREHFYAEVERLKERYGQFSTSYLQGQLSVMSIKECATAAKAVLAERENGLTRTRYRNRVGLAK